MHHPVDFETTLINEFPSKYHPYLVDEKYASHVVSVSKHQSAMLKKYLNRDSYVIHNGIPIQQWSEYTQSSGDYFAYLGYISGFKGVGQAIQAILKTDKKLIIAGPVDEHDIASVSYFKNEVEPYLKLGQIEYIGPLNLKEKQKFLQGAVATLMPVQWDEPFGLVAIESLASGTPVIANARGALPEIIEDGVSGYLVETIDGLAEKINQVHVLNRDNARKRYLEYFTSDNMVNAYEALYYDLIDQHT
jgi:glycosyltransferase involved in cell wall biosynthesis